jgi:hypothetical protein
MASRITLRRSLDVRSTTIEHPVTNTEFRSAHRTSAARPAVVGTNAAGMEHSARNTAVGPSDESAG